MGFLKPKAKTSSNVPSEFLPYGRQALGRAEELLDNPLLNIKKMEGQLGIKPGVKATPAMFESQQALRGAFPSVSSLFGAAGDQTGSTVGGDYLDPTMKAWGQHLQGIMGGDYLDPTRAPGSDYARRVIGGEFLNPAESPAFQDLSDAIHRTGQNTFQGMVDQTRGNAAVRGNFYSSARQNAETDAAARVSSEIADTLARAGTALYGQERGMQGDAARHLDSLYANERGAQDDAAARLGALYGQERGFQEAASGRSQDLFSGLASQLFGQGQGFMDAKVKDQALRIADAQAMQGLRDTPIQQIAQLLGAVSGSTVHQPSTGSMILSGIGSALSPSGIFGGK